MIVLKFGGSCLDKPSDCRRMAAMIRSSEELRPVVVLSAFKGVTDELIGQANSAKESEFDASGIETRHREVVEELPEGIAEGVAPKVDGLLRELRGKLDEVGRRRKFSPAELDDISAYGEKLAINVAAGYLAEAGLVGAPVSDAEAGILTDGVFGNATILDESAALVRERLARVRVPLVAGFFGADRAGRITTLGRGASDYVATFIAAAFGCKAVLFKDVDGVMTADPKVVPAARLIPKLSYQTAMELARYGSKVLFEKAVVPAMKAGIPLEIRSFTKDGGGTTVAAEGEGEAVSYVKEASVIRASGESVGSAESRLGEIYERDPVAVASVSQDVLVVTTARDRAESASKVVSSTGRDVKVDVRGQVSLVALTGKRFSESNVGEAIRRSGVEPIYVLRARSGMTVCAVVATGDMDAAVRGLHGLLVVGS